VLAAAGCGARAARRARAVEGAIYAYVSLGAQHARQGEYDEAEQAYATALDIENGGHDPMASRARRRAQNSLAWLLATCPDDDTRDGERALALARQIVAAVPRDAVYLNTLAAAYAEAGRFADAVDAQERALGSLPPHHALHDAYVERLRAYRDGRPWRDAPVAPAGAAP
jgi:tetratricopeptide (TPR) repeat protein